MLPSCELNVTRQIRVPSADLLERETVSAPGMRQDTSNADNADFIWLLLAKTEISDVVFTPVLRENSPPRGIVPFVSVDTAPSFAGFTPASAAMSVGHPGRSGAHASQLRDEAMDDPSAHSIATGGMSYSSVRNVISQAVSNGKNLHAMVGVAETIGGIRLGLLVGFADLQAIH